MWVLQGMSGCCGSFWLKSIAGAVERTRLKAILVTVLRPYLKQSGSVIIPHAEVPSTYIKAAFFAPSEVLARNHAPEPDAIEYRFDENRALYLRLMPTRARVQPIKITDLY